MRSRGTTGRRPSAWAALLTLMVVLSGCVLAPRASVLPSAELPAATNAQGLPAFSHVWIIVFENHSDSEILGDAAAPTINGLIDKYGLATAYAAVGRPSLPNYLALFSGSTQGVTDDKTHDFDAPTIADQIEAAGRTWGAYAENLPPGCFLGAHADGGRDGTGGYVRKHMPALSFTSITSNPARCAKVGDLTSFQPGATDYALIAPNLCHDMHDCSVAEGDAWLAGFLPRILSSSAFANDGVLFITFDEGKGSDPGAGRVPTIVVSPRTPAGYRSDVPHDHYSLLRTIEDAWGMPCLANACESGAMSEFFPHR